MNKFKSHFKFNKQERSGIFFLLLIIVLLQLGYFIYSYLNASISSEVFKVDEATELQLAILKEKASKKDTIKQYPFNPNYITDYKGYVLGMSVEEIDRLHAFRLKNKYINSAKEFQDITLVSDSLLKKIVPYFKFPEWASQKNNTRVVKKNSVKKVNHVKDLNTATAAELKKINGVGDKLSKRIVKFRKTLGGFLLDNQLEDVYGLQPEVVNRILFNYRVLSKPKITQVNINEASAYEISKIAYISYPVAKKIIAYKQENGLVKSFEELNKIEGFPADKIDRIKLYLYIKLLE